VHADALPHPVLGLYLRADSLAEAEAAADSLWRHVVLLVPQRKFLSRLMVRSTSFRRR
jgi:hypothetical protein